MSNKRLITALLLFLPLLCQAQGLTGLSSLKQKALQGPFTVEEDCFVQLFIISDRNNSNVDMPVSYHFQHNNIGMVANKTVYGESTDGKDGVKLVFKKSIKKLERYNLAVLNFKGATLNYSPDEGLTARGLDETLLVSARPGAKGMLPRKVLTIDQLTTDDIFTYVFVTDCEFVAKDGTLSNVYEGYAMKSKVNSKVGPNGEIAAWANLITDSRGHTIYSIINTCCDWRRDNGAGVPAGRGWIEGIVVPGYLQRYGKHTLEPVAIRPLSAEDYHFSETESAWKTISQWTWNDGMPEFVTSKGEMKKAGKVNIVSETGKGAIFVPFANVTREFDLNNKVVQAGTDNNCKGKIIHGAMRVTTESKNWWNWKNNQGNGINIYLNTLKLSGERMMLAFSFAGGAINPKEAFGFPCWWEVVWSAEGVPEQKLPGVIELRGFPYYHMTEHRGVKYRMSKEQGAGFTEHAVLLPPDIFGKDKVKICIRPASTTLRSLSYENSDNMANRPNLRSKSSVNFGYVVLRYN